MSSLRPMEAGSYMEQHGSQKLVARHIKFANYQPWSDMGKSCLPRDTNQKRQDALALVPQSAANIEGGDPITQRHCGRTGLIFVYRQKAGSPVATSAMAETLESGSAAVI